MSAVTRKFKQFQPFEKSHAKFKENTTHEKNCSRCSRVHEFGACPATGKCCHKCNKTGDFEIVSKTKHVGAVKTTDADSDEGSVWFLGAVSEDTDLDEEKWFTDLQINGVTVQFRIDTGADITVISENTYLSLPQRHFLKNTKALFTSPGGKLVCKGKFQTDCVKKGQKYTF